MRGQYPCGGMHRREFVGAAAFSILGAAVASAQEPKGKADPAQERALGIPGPYPGRVIEIRNSALKRSEGKNRAAVRETLNRGLVALTGASDSVEAWRIFVEPGEAVGIKVVPNGYPGAHTSPELILEVIDGLRSAGIKLKDMVVFDRYGLEFQQARYQDILPDGVARGGLTPVAWDHLPTLRQRPSCRGRNRCSQEHEPRTGQQCLSLALVPPRHRDGRLHPRGR
jgi:hypothetical protein